MTQEEIENLERELLWKHVPKIIETLAELLDSENETVRTTASKELNQMRLRLEKLKPAPEDDTNKKSLLDDLFQDEDEL